MRGPHLWQTTADIEGTLGLSSGLGNLSPEPSEPLIPETGPPSTATQLPMCGSGAGQRPAAFVLLTLDNPETRPAGSGRWGAAARGQRDGPRGGLQPAPGGGGGPIGVPAALCTGGGCPAGPCRPGHGRPRLFRRPGSKGGPGECVQGAGVHGGASPGPFRGSRLRPTPPGSACKVIRDGLTLTLTPT